MTLVIPVKRLHSRADSLFSKFERGGGTDYINQAIVVDRQALDLCPPGHRKRWVSLVQLQYHLGHRHDQMGEMADIEEAIILCREALDLCPPSHPDRATSLDNLSIHLSTRYDHLGDMTDLDQAIVLAREALNLCAKEDPDRSTYLNNLGLYLSARYKQLGIMVDLDEAIVLARETLDLCPLGDPDRSMSLSNLAVHFSTRYNRLGEMSDLDEAISFDREALDLRPLGHPDRSMSLSNLAVHLSTLYNQHGEMSDLDEAILRGQEALDLRPGGHPDRSMSLSNLALYLSTRYKQLGMMTDLDAAIVLGREALDLRPPGNPDRSMSLSNLAVHFYTRYKQLEAMTDLGEAITLGREALNLRPSGNPDRSMSLSNLTAFLSSQYKEIGTMAYLNEAVMLGQEAVDLRPSGHPDRARSLSNLATNLSSRYKEVGVMAQLDEAIVLDREALDLCPSGHPDRTMSLSNFARDLSARYERLKAITDLEEAIAFARDALQLCPSGHPDRSQSLGNLARYLRTQHTYSSQPGDQKVEEIFSLYTELADVPHMVSSFDLSAANAWVDAAEDFRHSTSLFAYETSLRLLTQHLATLPSLPQHLPILKKLASSLAVDAFSACLRNHRPVKAVELMEQGRSVFWNQIMRLRSPLDDVIASGPAGKNMADEFTRLTSLIRSAIESPGEDQHDRVCRLNLDLHRAVTNIRRLPGLDRFLLPSQFSDLRFAAREGPVVIVNASKYTCDALVICADREPVHIPLRITKGRVRDLSLEIQSLAFRAKKMDVRSDLGRFLRDLWAEVVLPIADFLRTAHPTQSRIWWCPTAEFSLLPLHAAGPYRKGQQNLSHLYISSYTPTLTALLRARRPNPTIFTTEEKNFVGIGQATAIGESELASVGSELAIIGQRIKGLATFTQIEGMESRISRVSEALCENQWVHLACHGLPNRKQPFESAFALHDGRFTIKHIMRCELQNPQFAYLSACHTTVGDEESPDEVIHLASAMLFAGFRSVIGTMWAVDDGQTNRITSMFYDNMTDVSGRLDHTRAAFALNKTLRGLTNMPLDQRILYIHIGA